MLKDKAHRIGHKLEGKYVWQVTSGEDIRIIRKHNIRVGLSENII